MPAPLSRFKSAFSLIEVAIVIVIIGLIIGGIVLGRGVIRNSQLQSVVSDIGNFQNGMKMFQEKYKYLPGDFMGATELWGAQGGCTVNTTSTTSTCNGDGDGFVSRMTGPTTTYTVSAENYYAWKHMVNAGFLTIKWDSFGYGRPASKVTGNLYTLFYSPPTVAGMSGAYAAKYGHVIVYGTSYTSASYPSYGAGLTGTEAYSIDQKMDDGKPGTGLVLTYTTAGASPVLTCANGTNANTSIYNVLSSDTPNCALIFRTGF